jgi:sugar phosphate isomerase/epimerase
MKVAVKAAALGDDLRSLCLLARRCGFYGLQLDLTLGDLDLTELSTSGQRDVKNTIARHELELASVGIHLPAAGLAEEDAERNLWLVDRAMKAAAGIAAKLICLDVGRLPAVSPESGLKPISPQQAGVILIPEPKGIAEAKGEPVTPEELAQWEAVDVVLRQIGTIADRYGIMVAMSSELSSFASLQRAIERAGCQWLGVDLDPVSVLRDRWDLEHVLDAVGGLVLHVRARDAAKGSDRRTQPAAIGKGSTNWKEMLALLSQGGYTGWITVDTMDLQDRAAEAVRARDLLFGDPMRA